jgi:hypothetical protein
MIRAIIAITLAVLAGPVLADEVVTCDGMLTSNGTCIGSESNVPPPVVQCDGQQCWRIHRHRN